MNEDFALGLFVHLRYSPVEDALYVKFARCDNPTKATTIPATDNGNVFLDYSDKQVLMGVEFLWMSDRTKCHHKNNNHFDHTKMSGGTISRSLIHIYFVDVKNVAFREVPCKVDGIAELVAVDDDDRLVGFQIRL